MASLKARMIAKKLRSCSAVAGCTEFPYVSQKMQLRAGTKARAYIAGLSLLHFKILETRQHRLLLKLENACLFLGFGMCALVMAVQACQG